VERVRVRKDGTLRTVWVEDQLVRDAAGNVVGLRSAQLDITERKQAEAERERLYEAERAARAEAEAAIDARQAMTATVTHDLKNPLASIKGWAQLLRRRAARGAAIEADQLLKTATTIEATAKRMAGLLDELLDASVLQAGRTLDLRRRPTDLVALVREAVQEHQQAADRHAIRLEATEPELVGTWDGPRLERVLANVLSNAVKYSPRGGEIAVQVCRRADEATVVVRDQGLGIPEADLPHVFDRFRRASNVAGRIAGTGLGLAGAREIVLAHGGDITVESREGAGTTVTVALPLGDGPGGGPGLGGSAEVMRL
jgi:signal transduction histidine kinase